MPISIEDLPSSAIRFEARTVGLADFRVVAEGGSGENHITLYEYTHPRGWRARVANTNGEPVWEEDDNFGELLESTGIYPCYIAAEFIGEMPNADARGIETREREEAMCEALAIAYPDADFRPFTGAPSLATDGGVWIPEVVWLAAVRAADYTFKVAN